MKTLMAIHPWMLIEDTLHREDMRLAESLTSLGNAHFGMRGNFEEQYTGDTHRGTYLAGVWFPDKTRVGWWKNGYPAYFGKVINAVNLLEIGVTVNGEAIDLGKNEVLSYRRELDMEHGLLHREATVRLAGGTVKIEVERFLSIVRKEVLAIRYLVTPSYPATVRFTPAIDANVRNEDSNYNETFWEMLDARREDDAAYILTQTRENPFGTPRFTVCAAMDVPENTNVCASEGRVSAETAHTVAAGETAEIVKITAVDTSRNHETGVALTAHVLSALSAAKAEGYGPLRQAHAAAWRARWDHMDVRIDGDDAAQQGIRFNLFQMFSTYDGTDPRLNIGPKGFTGEKYGGATYWDTEMFCLPMILSVMPKEAAESLLLYRYLHLEKAKENANKLGVKGALYPMVTFTGEECHNEWEITFEEIHRNAAIFYAIFMVQQYNGDDQQLRRYGLPVMLEICRYWEGRITWNPGRHHAMILGVTGPNEYENNVNNNWYTNRMAKFCLEQFVEYVNTVIGMTAACRAGSSEQEIARFEKIAKAMYLPEDRKLGVFLQQDGFLDKALIPADKLPPEERPINQHWSWDRILRSCYIKQADTLQGLYCLRHLYDTETIRRNFEFYEPLTVHESSLSSSIHAILAADIGQWDKAVEMYRRTARLDLDNVNNDTEDGLHITSMCGSWMAIVKGFAGLRTEDGTLTLSPHVPPAFRSFGFTIGYQGRRIAFDVADGDITATLLEGPPLAVQVYGEYRVLERSRNAAIKKPKGGAQ